MEQLTDQQALLMFWAIGDLHYRALPFWHELHSARLAPMFDDLHALWQTEGKPAFCVSPGDLVETCAIENYQLAKARLAEELGDIPLYPGLGNHEYHGPNGEDPSRMEATFNEVWRKPARYSWEAGEVVGIMLDYPDVSTLENIQRVYISSRTLAFLDDELAKHPTQTAIIFLHCPLANTVLDRDPAQHRDYNSLEHFFAPENSQEVRDILTRHDTPKLLFSGHTHTGWEAPGLVKVEQLGTHSTTFVNLMSPWYTGRGTGARMSEDYRSATYRADEPDVIPTFQVTIYQQQASIRVRDHRTQRWLKEWIVPLQ
jgi:3',5'-cyclic AMP phosphodiesterase CpdA